jgi:hypothetical protein
MVLVPFLRQAGRFSFAQLWYAGHADDSESVLDKNVIVNYASYPAGICIAQRTCKDSLGHLQKGS